MNFSFDQVAAQELALRTGEDCMKIRIGDEMKLDFLTTATKTCLEATDCAALKIVETLMYQIVTASL